ncbi:hypothetical protein ACHAWF_012017 [Thalassiosira exigua]
MRLQGTSMPGTADRMSTARISTTRCRCVPPLRLRASDHFPPAKQLTHVRLSDFFAPPPAWRSIVCFATATNLVIVDVDITTMAFAAAAGAAPRRPPQPGAIISESDLLPDGADSTWLSTVDAVLLLGGGAPSSPVDPPPHVRERCDAVASLHSKLRAAGVVPGPAVVCLSAGTAHVPQYITPRDGLPLWESTASAACLLEHPLHPVPPDRVYVETASYDTISNAYFARTTMTDVAGWRTLLIVTSEFHAKRTKAVFDWIFGAPASDGGRSPSSSSSSGSPYEMYYLSTANVGLSAEALASRRSHEAGGEANVRAVLANQYPALRDVWEFLTVEHDFYAAERLVRRAVAGDGGASGAGPKSDDALKSSYYAAERLVRRAVAGDGDASGAGPKSDDALKLSYGSTSSKKGGGKGLVRYEAGKVVLSLHPIVAIASLAVVVGMCLSMRQRENVRAARNREHLE